MIDSFISHLSLHPLPQIRRHAMNEQLPELLLAITGDESALTTLILTYGPHIQKRIQHLIPARFQALLDAEDIMQETYAEVVLDISAFRREMSFEGWMMNIAKHNLMDAIRGLKSIKRGGRSQPKRSGTTRRHSSDDNFGDDFLDLIPGSGTTPSERLARKETRELVDGWLVSIPAGYRNVLILYDIEGNTPEEVAMLLGCSIGAMYMRRSRALRMLRRIAPVPSHLLSEQAEL